jgi:hypothetical protein
MKAAKKHKSKRLHKHRNLQRIAYFNTGSLEDAQKFNLVGSEPDNPETNGFLRLWLKKLLVLICDFNLRVN